LADERRRESTIRSLPHAPLARPAQGVFNQRVAGGAQRARAGFGVRLSAIPVAAGAPWSLRLYLDRFEQVYQPDLHSQGEARWQAELRHSHGALRARHTFSASAPASQAHAEAGARALGAASDALIEDTLRWAREGGVR
jgi:ABC-type uncharacterized transport system auxiliary subunit